MSKSFSFLSLRKGGNVWDRQKQARPKLTKLRCFFKGGHGTIGQNPKTMTLPLAMGRRVVSQLQKRRSRIIGKNGKRSRGKLRSISYVNPRQLIADGLSILTPFIEEVLPHSNAESLSLDTTIALLLPA